jgi:hypothetical protein
MSDLIDGLRHPLADPTYKLKHVGLAGGATYERFSNPARILPPPDQIDRLRRNQWPDDVLRYKNDIGRAGEVRRLS